MKFGRAENLFEHSGNKRFCRVLSSAVVLFTNICKGWLQALLSSAPRGFAARSRVLARLVYRRP